MYGQVGWPRLHSQDELAKDRLASAVALCVQRRPSRKDFPGSASRGAIPVPAFEEIDGELYTRQRLLGLVRTPLGRRDVALLQNGSSLRPPPCATHTLPIPLLALRVRQSNCSTYVAINEESNFYKQATT